MPTDPLLADDAEIPASVAALPSGTSLLVRGPPMTGKREIALDLLASDRDADEGVLCVTPSDSASQLVDVLEGRVDSLDRSRVGIVDCTGSDRSRQPDGVAMEYVTSPSDLTGISIGTVKVLETLAERGASSIRHGILSLSTVLHYLDAKTVFKFLHVYTARIRDTDGIGVFTLDTTSHAPETVNTLSSEFDRIIELRETESGEREARMVGVPGASRRWQRY